MTTHDSTDERLDELGDALRSATTAHLAQAGAPSAAPSRAATARTGSRRRRAIVAAVVVAVIGVPGVAIAANALISNDDVAQSIPAGTLALMGTEPTCTTVDEGVEFDCTLAHAPRGELAPGAWRDTVEPTVGADKRVNGGCRSLNGAGTHWRCYIGREAVAQRIVGEGFLGQPVSGPGVG
jgi:hypothetical protein